MSSGRTLADAHCPLRFAVRAGAVVLLCLAMATVNHLPAADFSPEPVELDSVLVASPVSEDAHDPVGTGVLPAAEQAAYFDEPLPAQSQWPSGVPTIEPFAGQSRHAHHQSGEDRYYGPEYLWESLGLPIVIEVPAWAIPEPPLYHRNLNDPFRHHGIGQPLVGTSWLNRPYSIGWFVGGMFGQGTVNDQMRQDEDAFGGYRAGWDFDHYWGTEGRIGFAQLPSYDTRGNMIADTQVRYYDLHLLHYPWGDARWRPYWSVGLGVSTWDMESVTGQNYQTTLFQIPIGLGVKYQWTKWLTLRMEAMNNITFGDEAYNTMHNLSLTAGFEFRFGGRPRSYYPWNPSMSIW